MATLDQVAQAALDRDAMLLRTLAADWLRQNPKLSDCPRPGGDDPRALSVAAALVELFSERAAQPPPAWTAEVGSVGEPIYLLRSASSMKRLRELCEKESPPPFKRRGLYAPPDFLSFA